MIPIDLSGKVAVVTGGIQGLGKATASMLLQAGARIAVNYFDDESGVCRQRAEEAASEWGDTSFTMAADVRSRRDMVAFFDAVQAKFGRVDYLINNAAILRDRSVRNLTDEEWDAVVETNLSAVFKVSQTALPYLQDGGRIVNMASISGVVGFFGQAN